MEPVFKLFSSSGGMCSFSVVFMVETKNSEISYKNCLWAKGDKKLYQMVFKINIRNLVN